MPIITAWVQHYKGSFIQCKNQENQYKEWKLRREKKLFLFIEDTVYIESLEEPIDRITKLFQ